jgi:hypothetical protein
MTQTTEHTATFDVCDGNSRHAIYEYTIFNHSNAGGIQRKTPADCHYKTSTGNNVGHMNHNQFQLPGSNLWLSKCNP